MSKSEAESDANIVTGTFLVNSKPAFVLFDSGASHSFLSKSFIEKHSLKPSSSCQAKVTTSSGETFLSKNLYLGMPIVISETELPVKLIEFNLKDFDLVLGMDWLRKYQAKINCAKQRITFRGPKGNKLTYQETTSEPPKTKLISALNLQTRLRKGYPVICAM